MDKRGDNIFFSKQHAFVLSFIFLTFLSIGIINAISPSGANVNVLNSSTATADAAGSVPAQAGNVSELNIFGYSTTQTWQGYFGNVTGAIKLADSSGSVI